MCDIEIFLLFQIFEAFENLKIDFRIDLKNNSEQLSKLSKMYHFFIKLSPYYKTGSNRVVAIPCYQTY